MKKKKVLFIASTGGHLNELMQLSPMFNNYNYYIITEKTKSNISLIEKYQRRIYRRRPDFHQRRKRFRKNNFAKAYLRALRCAKWLY